MSDAPVRWQKRYPEIALFETEEQQAHACRAAALRVKRWISTWVICVIGLLVLAGLLAPVIDSGLREVLREVPGAVRIVETGLVVVLVLLLGYILHHVSQRVVRTSLRRQLIGLGVPVCLGCGCGLGDLPASRCPQCARNCGDEAWEALSARDSAGGDHAERS